MLPWPAARNIDGSCQEGGLPTAITSLPVDHPRTIHGLPSSTLCQKRVDDSILACGTLFFRPDCGTSDRHQLWLVGCQSTCLQSRSRRHLGLSSRVRGAKSELAGEVSHSLYGKRRRVASMMLVSRTGCSWPGGWRLQLLVLLSALVLGSARQNSRLTLESHLHIQAQQVQAPAAWLNVVQTTDRPASHSAASIGTLLAASSSLELPASLQLFSRGGPFGQQVGD